MKYLALIPLLLCTPACTSTGEPDWAIVETELSLAQKDLLDLAKLVETDKPEVASQLRHLADYIGAIEGAVAAYNAGETEGGEVFAAIDAALELASELMEEDDNVRIYVAAARLILRRVKAYLPAD